MLSRLIFCILFFSSCQRGLIPCPTVELAKYNEKPHRQRQAIMAVAREEPREKNNWKRPKEKVVQHVTLEEWDCPPLGKKKHIPRSVKQNIRKNEKLIHSGDPDQTNTDQP